MKKSRIIKAGIVIECLILIPILLFGFKKENFGYQSVTSEDAKKEYIKWVDFNVSADALNTAYQCDLDAHENGCEVGWIELLAYVGAKHGGEFGKGTSGEITALYESLKSGEKKLSDLTADMKYYSYYLEAYTAVLGGYVGEYEVETDRGGAAAGSGKAAAENGGTGTDDGKAAADSGGTGTDDGQAAAGSGDAGKTWETRYGLKAFSPIAKGFEYSDYDDFGASRSYGYKRVHLGHDMTGQIGTPIICVESGYVEALGWNQYGGWRIGIRSFDKKRYYYYAHLRQNFPYAKWLKEGSIVTAGDVIGYLGHTGYSATENVNNIDVPHLHFGIQLIFDESQKEGNNEIWIDCYQLVQFLTKNRSLTVKDAETKEWSRVYGMREQAVEEAKKSGNMGSAEPETESEPGTGENS